MIESVEMILSLAVSLLTVLGVVRGYFGVAPLKRKVDSLRETLKSLRESTFSMESEGVPPDIGKRRVEEVQKLVRFYEGQLVAEALIPQKIKSAQYLLLSFPILIGAIAGFSCGIFFGVPGFGKLVGLGMAFLTFVIFVIGWRPVSDFLSAIIDQKQVCAWSFAKKPEVFEEFVQAEAWTFELPRKKGRIRNLVEFKSWKRADSKRGPIANGELHDGFELILLALMALAALTSFQLMAPVLGLSPEGFYVFWFAATLLIGFLGWSLVRDSGRANMDHRLQQWIENRS